MRRRIVAEMRRKRELAETSFEPLSLFQAFAMGRFNDEF